MTARPAARRWRLAMALLVLFSASHIVEARTEAVDYYGVDAVGSIRVVFRPDGTVVGRADYAPFGEAAEGTTGQLPVTQFTGQERDPEAAQDYFHARYYQPRHGRFGSVDPVFGNLFEPQQLGETLKRIEHGVKLGFRNDGAVFANREGLLPARQPGYYREFVHPTPGLSGPGAQRIVTGAGGEAYYTGNHYHSFVRIR